jgi:phage protein D
MAVVADPKREVAQAQFRAKVDGTTLAPELDWAIESIVVDERLHVPTMFEIRLADPHLKLIDDARLREGKEIEILAGPASSEKSLCLGKITTIDADLAETQPVLTIRGYDLSFALHRDVQSRSFIDQTDDEIVTQIANDVGLTPRVDVTGVQHPYVFQHARTNYAFLQERAERHGFELRVVDRELRFRRPQPEGTPIDLQWGVNLRRFRPRLSVAEQVDEVQVRGWNVAQKDAIVGRATSSDSVPTIGESQPGGGLAQRVWGRAKRVVVDRPVLDQEEANQFAQALLDDIASSFIHAEGECDADPRLRVGVTVRIEGVGTRFGGTYYLTAVTHRFSKHAGHQVSFTASTRKPQTLPAQLATPHRDERRSEAVGVVIGIVTNNEDPEKMARVKVKCPWLYDEDESFWARLAPPMAGPDRGFLVIPEINDEVLLAFEHGDPARPYVLGALWNGQDQPPQGTGPVLDGGVVNQRIWRSRSGHLFVFDDTDGQESIVIVDKTGNNRITIRSNDNALDVQMAGNVEIVADGNMRLKARSGIELTTDSGKIRLEGPIVEIAGKATTKIEGGIVDIDGNPITLN